MKLTQEQLNSLAKTNGIYKVSGKDLGIKRIVADRKVVYLGVWTLYAEKVRPAFEALKITSLLAQDPHAIVGFESCSILQQVRSRIGRYVGEIVEIQSDITDYIQSIMKNPFEPQKIRIAKSGIKNHFFCWYLTNECQLKEREGSVSHLPLYRDAIEVNYTDS